MAFDAIKKMISSFLGKFSIGVAVNKQIKNVAQLGGAFVATKLMGVEDPAQTAAVSGAIFTLLDLTRNFIKTKFKISWL